MGTLLSVPHTAKVVTPTWTSTQPSSIVTSSSPASLPQSFRAASLTASQLQTGTPDHRMQQKAHSWSAPSTSSSDHATTRHASASRVLILLVDSASSMAASPHPTHWMLRSAGSRLTGIIASQQRTVPTHREQRSPPQQTVPTHREPCGKTPPQHNVPTHREQCGNFNWLTISR
jgi:hypothetical protein